MSSLNLPAHVIQSILSEIKILSTKPLHGITVLLNETNVTDIQALIEGPVGTPYEGGIFKCKLVLTNEFPQTAPRGFFLTKIFHPNVNMNGDICVNTLKKDWQPNLGLSHIFQVIRCLLIVPFPESALNEDASKLFLESYDEYARRAKLMTSIHSISKMSIDSFSQNDHADSKVNTSDDYLKQKNMTEIIVDHLAIENIPTTVNVLIKNHTLSKKVSTRKRNLKRL